MDQDMIEKLRISRNLLYGCMREVKEKLERVDVQDITRRLAHYTGVDRETLEEIRLKHKVSSYKTWQELWKNKKTVNSYENIRDFLVKCYIHEHKIPVEMDIIKDTAIRLPNILYSTKKLQKDLTVHGFIYRPIPKTNRSLITEDPERVFRRCNYLKTLSRYREEGRNIVYLEQVELSFKDESSEEQSIWILIAVIPDTGIQNVVYSDIATKIDDINCLVSFMENIPETCVIVLGEDHCSNTSKQVIPDINSKKTFMKLWLMENDIPFDEDAHRAELLKLIEIHNQRYGKDVCKVEELLKGLGYYVLRRPNSLPKLNFYAAVFEYIGKMLKNTNGDSLRDKLADVIQRFTPADWKKFDEICAANEKEVYDEDVEMEDIIDKVLMMAREKQLTDKDLEECCKMYVDRLSQILIRNEDQN